MTVVEGQEAFDFLAGSPGAEVRLGWRLATLRVGDQRDEGDTAVVLFSDRTEVAEAEYFREFEGCTVPWNWGAGPGPALPGA